MTTPTTSGKVEAMSYFTQVGEARFAPTQHVGGAWNPAEQHVAPALGLMVHAVETDRDRRRHDALVISRLSYDILGTLPMEPIDIEVHLRRPGRTIELVEATLSHQGRPAVLLRAWLQLPSNTTAHAGTGLSPISPPANVPPWDATTVWPGGFIASAQVRRQRHAPGRAVFWVETEVPLLDPGATRQPSPTAAAAGLLDIANGMAVRAHPNELAFPNIDLTAHLLRAPVPGPLGFDTTVSFGPTGLGVTSTTLHDTHGPLGTMSQTLTLRPRT